MDANGREFEVEHKKKQTRLVTRSHRTHNNAKFMYFSYNCVESELKIMYMSVCLYGGRAKTVDLNFFWGLSCPR